MDNRKTKLADKKISVIIPIYNAEKYIIRCLNSVVNQTYDNNNIECVLVNDCSSDSSMENIQDFLNDYQGNVTFITINHTINKGVSEARNSGLLAAKGDYIFFLDSDDFLDSKCLEKLINATYKFPDAQMIVGNNINIINNTIHHTDKETLYYNDNERIIGDILLFIFPSYPWNKLVLREFIIKNKLFFQSNMVYIEDLYWNIEVARCLSAIVYLPDITYSYEDTPGSIMSTISTKNEKVATNYMNLILKLWEKRYQPYIETHLCISHFIMRIFSILPKNSITRKQAVTFRTKMIKDVFLHRHLFLFIYDLQSFYPLRKLFNTKYIHNRSVNFRLSIYNLSKKFVI